MSQRALPTNKVMSILNGSPSYQESLTVTSGATVRNATAFTGGETLVLQSDQDFYVSQGLVATDVTAANGMKVLAGEKYVITLQDGDRNIANKQTHICCLAVSATATVKVFKLF